MDNRSRRATCQLAVGDGGQAVRYLAPYVYRVAISNRRRIKCEPGPDGLGRVTFAYCKSGRRRWRAMTVTAEEFIRRFLQHVLPIDAFKPSCRRVPGGAPGDKENNRSTRLRKVDELRQNLIRPR